MSFIAGRSRTIQPGETYFKSRYRCLNENCRRKGCIILPRRKDCPKCYAHTEIIGLVKCVKS